MKSLSYYLTSSKLPPTLPDILDHYFFTDPVTGLNFTYPTTAFGWYLSGGSDTGTGSSSAFALTADGTAFFPWGYRVQTETRLVQLKNQKGDITITFVPSGFDTQYHDVGKIVYDCNGTVTNIERPLLSRSVSPSLDNFTLGVEVDSPTQKPISHTYYASSAPITCYTNITAFYMDMTYVFYYINFTLYPNSIYDVDNVHLINSTQLPLLSDASLNILEIESEQLITNSILQRQ